MEKNSSQNQTDANPPNGSANGPGYISTKHLEFERTLRTTPKIFLRDRRKKQEINIFHYLPDWPIFSQIRQWFSQIRQWRIFVRIGLWPIFSKHNRIILITLGLLSLAILLLVDFLLNIVGVARLLGHASTNADNAANNILVPAAIAGLGATLTLFFSELRRARVRVGIAETLASDVLSIGRVIIASGILHDITGGKASDKQPEGRKELIAEFPRETWEDYFVVYHKTLGDLRTFRSDVVVEITAFYTLLKGSRDRIETLRSTKRRHLESYERFLQAPNKTKMCNFNWEKKEKEFDDLRGKLLADVLYILLAFAEHGRSCMESLLEKYDPLNDFGQNMFRLFELQLIYCLDEQIEEEKKVLDKYRAHLIKSLTRYPIS